MLCQNLDLPVAVIDSVAKQSKTATSSLLLLTELGLPTADTITLMFCLLVIARCHAIRSFSGSQTLLCSNFIFCGFRLFLVCIY